MIIIKKCVLTKLDLVYIPRPRPAPPRPPLCECGSMVYLRAKGKVSGLYCVS